MKDKSVDFQPCPGRRRHRAARLARRFFLWTFFACGTCLTAAYGQLDSSDQAEFSAAEIEFFESRIRPVLVEHCYECHSGTELSGGLSLESRQQMLTGGDSGPALDLNAAESSLLLTAIDYQNPELQMPPKGRLAPTQIAALKQWVARGAADPRQPPSSDSEQTQPLVGLSLEEGRQFWAFQPVGNPPLPDVQNIAWLQSPVDSFVLGRLEQLQLEPAPPADRRTLIRRLSLNLTGLPPTPEEVDQFVADDSPQAFSNLVERLLASPQYGVRWGRHWLDVARYADSNGLDENLAFGNAWRYRDYVIEAFNRDKPYHRFVVEQIAGDLLPHANQETRTATGLLCMGAKVLAEPDMEKLVMDTIDEQLDTVGKAFLGMSLGCARCHDHKFDPLTQRDYYALAAIFKGTRTFSGQRFGAIKYWYEHSLANEEDLQKISAIDAEIAAAKAAAAGFKSGEMAKIRLHAQQNAVQYLVAATVVKPGDTLVDVAAIAEPLGLHPRILYHCRAHLENQRSSEFFEAWHRLADQPELLRKHYDTLFDPVLQAANPQAANLQDAAPASTEEPQFVRAKAELNDPSGFLVVPPQVEFAFDSTALGEYYRLMDIARELESSAADLPEAMGVSDGIPVSKLAIHIRGSHLNLGPAVSRDFPEVMQTSTVSPIFAETQSGRLELAEWLASTSHPLTARVMVNRIWGWHFGRPLVTTTENFGTQGSRPSHPDLLDWLSRQFMQSGWSIKNLHRMILNSSTYQMSSQHPRAEEFSLADPENGDLWKFNIQRMDAEQLRDSILAVSDRIDTSLAGKTVPLRNRQFVFDHTSIDHTRYDSLRRAAYLPIIRNNIYTMFEQFDFPDPTMPTGLRQATTVAPQSLLMMNSELILDSAWQLSDSLIRSYSDDESRLLRLYSCLLARPPSQSEQQRCLSFIAEMQRTLESETSPSADDPKVLTWTLLAQGLMSTNDFLYVR